MRSISNVIVAMESRRRAYFGSVVDISDKYTDSESDESNVVESDELPLIRPDVFDVSLTGELMTKNKQRNWRRIILIGVITIVVLGLVITVGILLSGSSGNGSSRQSKIVTAVTLDEWLTLSFSPRSFNGTWISDDEILYRNQIGNLIVYNVSSATSRSILNANNATQSSIFSWEISADRKYVLLASNYVKYFRHTYLAEYSIVNLETLAETTLQAVNGASLQLALWAPRGNGLVYVIKNNIYYRPAAEISHDYQITTTGVFGNIYNGVPDWVYEEEVLSSNKAMWFSPNGKKLAFAYFNNEETQTMNIPYYGYPGSLSFQYSSALQLRYPKPGTANPTVTLYYVDLELLSDGNATLNEIEPPKKLAHADRILANVVFATDNLISSTWMNRVQNEVYFNIFNVETSSYNTALSYSESHGWIDQFAASLFSRDGTAFLLILPRKQSDNDYWRHLVMVTNATGATPDAKALTSGKFVVTEILSWDEDNFQVYYVATNESDSGQQHLYRITTSDPDNQPECLSCNVHLESDGTRCLYNTAIFSKNNSHYVFVCGGPGVPEISIYESQNATKLSTWEDNRPISRKMAEKSKPTTKKFTVPVSDGFVAQVRLIIPPGADLSGATKYPMLVNVYGGPDTYQVTARFNVDWGTYLVTNKSIIYAAIDGRGSGLKGNSMLFSGYRKLGTVEIFDQINVTRYVQDNFSFVDRERTAIWGWSYGGYATGMSLAMDSNGVFKCGISVAPVTDWLLYDSVYTERFMGLPTVPDNLEGYERAQLLNKAKHIKSNSFYLIHGTFDDNVHYQQSLMLAKVLEQNDILFRQQTYTDEDHSLGQTRFHLYHSLENFLDGCFAH